MSAKMIDYQQKYDFYMHAAENVIAKSLDDAAIPSPLIEAMKYSLLFGGKRLRPVLLLAANDLLRGDIDEALPYACAIEMIHTYSLIHDDLPAMDNDILRRGKPTNHVVFGEAMAILAGDALLSHAFQIVSTHACHYQDNALAHIKAMSALAKGCGAEGMVGGQCCDIVSEEGCGDEKLLLYIHEKKTSALIIAALEAGLLLCRPAALQAEAIAEYGRNLGLAFQITDDILDVTGDEGKLGKTTGKDDAQNKFTSVNLYGLGESKQMVSNHIDAAIKSLECFGQNKAFLAELAQRMLNREN